MYSEARKLHLIEEVLKITNESTLNKLEVFLKVLPKTDDAIPLNSFSNFSGIWSEKESEEIEKAIAEGCEQIDSNDWK
jgi:hypothetical protein